MIGEGCEPHPGHYVVGWIKRGPTGVIGTNKKDAQETIETLLEDAAAGRCRSAERVDPDALPKLLAERGIHFIEFDGWQAIDALEQQRGAAGRPAADQADRPRGDARGGEKGWRWR